MSTYLITGTNRGLGLAFIKNLAANSSNLVIATVRNETAAQKVYELKKTNIKVIILDISAPYSEFEKALKALETLAPNGIDVLIHNAGIEGPNFFPPAKSYDVEAYSEVLNVNVGGTAKIYKAVYPYIFSGSETKKIVLISTLAGVTVDFKIGANAYGASKAAVNHFGVQIAREHAASEEKLVKDSITLLIHPGFVDTDMATNAKKVFGSDVFISADESAAKVLKVIDQATVEDTGKFYDENGNTMSF